MKVAGDVLAEERGGRMMLIIRRLFRNPETTNAKRLAKGAHRIWGYGELDSQPVYFWGYREIVTSAKPVGRGGIEKLIRAKLNSGYAEVDIMPLDTSRMMMKIQRRV